MRLWSDRRQRVVWGRFLPIRLGGAFGMQWPILTGLPGFRLIHWPWQGQGQGWMAQGGVSAMQAQRPSSSDFDSGSHSGTQEVSFLIRSSRDSGMVPGPCSITSVLSPPARRKHRHLIMIIALPSFGRGLIQYHQAPPLANWGPRLPNTCQYISLRCMVPLRDAAPVPGMPPCGDMLCSQLQKYCALKRGPPVLPRIFGTPLEWFYRCYNVVILFFRFLLPSFCRILLGYRTLKYSGSKICDPIYLVSLDDRECIVSICLQLPLQHR